MTLLFGGFVMLGASLHAQIKQPGGQEGSASGVKGGTPTQSTSSGVKGSESQTVINSAGSSFGQALNPNPEIDLNASYYIVPKHVDRVLSVLVYEDNKGPMMLADADGSLAQKWKFFPAGDGSYYITNGLSQRTMCVIHQSKDPGTEVWIWTTESTPAQRFKMVPRGNGYYSIESTFNGLVLDVNNARTDIGAPLIQWNYLGGANQLWRLTTQAPPKYQYPSDGIVDPARIYQIKPSHCEHTLGLDKPTERAGGTEGPVTIRENWAADYQQWQFVPGPDMTYHIRNVRTNTYLCVIYESHKPGEAIWVWRHENWPQERFRLSPNGNGTYSIISTFNGLAIDVLDAGTSLGTAVIQNTPTKSPSQSFTFMPL